MMSAERRALAEALRSALGRPLPGAAAHARMLPAFRAGEAAPEGLRPSAVLLPLAEGGSGPSLILIERSAGGLHGGQFAFPGGAEEEGDGGPEGTALREAREEIGLDPASAEILGRLSPVTISVSRFLVRPVLALVPDGLELAPNPAEVASIRRVGIGELLDPASKAEREIPVRGEIRKVPCYVFGDALVWGATAMILSELESMLLGAELEAVS